MIDPISAITLATSAYKGIKKAVEVGKEISSFTGAISQFAKASSDIDFLEQKSKKPPLYKMFSDTQSNALEIWTQKQKLKEMREELKTHISWTYGPSAWREIVAIEAQQRKEQRDLVYAKQEAIENLINAVVITIICVTGLGIAVGVIYFIGKQQGKW
jgi:transposase|tara:strand:+ start:325 stop:798 length:474 start_codon:yes stop_codon:yes gene_type:complete